MRQRKTRMKITTVKGRLPFLRVEIVNLAYPSVTRVMM